MSFLDIAKKAALLAGKYALDHISTEKDIKVKSLKNLTTDIDLACEDLICSTIGEAYPCHDFLTEEKNTKDTGSDYLWIIDPIDGTHNYVYGMVDFGISIALCHKGKLILGVIYIPMTKELYWAESGKGAFFDGKKINVSSRPLDKTMLLLQSRLGHGDFLSKVLASLMPKVFSQRVIGCAVRDLSYIARGSADIWINDRIHSWDYAAGVLLVQEAGGIVTSIDGSAFDIFQDTILVSNSEENHQTILRIIGGKEKCRQ